MRRITRVCDRCGKELPDGVMSYQLVTFEYSRGSEEVDGVEDGAELCEECYEAVDQAVTMAMLNQPEPETGEDLEEKPKDRRKLQLDFGKVKALHEAGWSGKAIADEMGVSAPTISKALTKIYEGGES